MDEFAVEILKRLPTIGRIGMNYFSGKKRRALMNQLHEQTQGLLQKQTMMQEENLKLVRELQMQQIQEAKETAEKLARQRADIMEENVFAKYWPLMTSHVQIRQEICDAWREGRPIPLQIILLTNPQMLESGSTGGFQNAMYSAVKKLAGFIGKNYARNTGNPTSAVLYTNHSGTGGHGDASDHLPTIYKVFHLAPTLVLNPYCEGGRFCMDCTYWDGSDIHKEWTPTFESVVSYDITSFTHSFLEDKVQAWRELSRSLPEIARGDADMSALANLMEQEKSAYENARKHGMGEEMVRKTLTSHFKAQYARFHNLYEAEIKDYIRDRVTSLCRLCTSLFTDIHYLLHGGQEPRSPRLCAEDLTKFPGSDALIHQLFLNALEARGDDPCSVTQIPLWHARLANAYQGTAMEKYTAGHCRQSVAALQQLVPAPQEDIRWTDTPEIKQAVDALCSLQDNKENQYIHHCFQTLHYSAETLCEMGKAALAAGDGDRAFQFFAHSAEKGCADAIFLLGGCHVSGRGTAKDDAKAFKCFRLAAEAGHAEAQFNLGRCYDTGTGCDKDGAEAAKWFCAAAKQGHAEAQYQLGCRLAQGTGVHQDEAEAAKCFRAAAEKGHAAAQYKLGCCLAYGTGVHKDAAEAAQCFLSAARQGHADAQLQLAYCYAYGVGVPKNEAEATKWFRAAAEQGHAQAWHQLGCRYESGTGIARNETEAAKCFLAAAKQGLAADQIRIGTCYKLGKGVDENGAEALKWYLMAAEQGNADAQFRLGKCYEEGCGTAQNAEQAEKWYSKAAANGHADAQFHLGVYNYMKHVDDTSEEAQSTGGVICLSVLSALTGVIWNKIRSSSDYYGNLAKFWFEKAAAQGHEDARRMLKEHWQS